MGHPLVAIWITLARPFPCSHVTEDDGTRLSDERVSEGYAARLITRLPDSLRLVQHLQSELSESP
jgi:hypothetical protein